MRKIDFARFIVFLIVLFNIVNYFVMAVAINGNHIIEGTTYLDATFYAYEPLENALGMHTGVGGGNKVIIFFFYLIVDLILLYFITLRPLKKGFRKCFVPIISFCVIGIFLHLFSFMVCIPSALRDDISYFNMIGKGMIIGLLYIISYIAIIEIIILINKKQIRDDDVITSKYSVFDVISFSIIIELILSFFYVSIVKRYYVVYNPGMNETRKYFNRYFFSSFVMGIKNGNYYNLFGKNEFYPYMWIILFGLIAELIFILVKNKATKYVVLSLSLINIILLIIGICDSFNSFFMRYVTTMKPNIFTVCGFGFYFVIILNIILILLNIKNNKIIVIDENIIEKMEENNSNISNIYIIESEDFK